MYRLTPQIGTLPGIGACLQFNICIVNGWNWFRHNRCDPREKVALWVVLDTLQSLHCLLSFPFCFEMASYTQIGG